MPETSYTCFVIAPFGEAGTESRKNFYDFMDCIVDQAFRLIHHAHFVVQNGLDSPTNDQIYNKVNDHISKADLCIADISEKNPNVYYEIGLCHALKKPLIFAKRINSADIATDLGVPDFAPYDFTDMRTVKASVLELHSRIEAKLGDIVKASTDSKNDLSAIIKLIQANTDSLVKLVQNEYIIKET